MIVPRTCTELVLNGDRGSSHGESKPLRDFRSTPAYVLLGDPGAGKTTEFKRECTALGDMAEYVTARDFLVLDIDSCPELHRKTLFIDGLDEIRAGGDTPRGPIDEIRRRLDHLRPPAFRISCREADWLGKNDRRALDFVLAEGQVTIIRLDPLNKESIAQMASSSISGSWKEFVNEAHRRGIWHLLENPLTLNLLVQAIDRGNGWPRTQRNTFEVACEALAREVNDEHLVEREFESFEILMDAAGYLCTIQLLAGIEGYSLSPRESSRSFVPLPQGDQAFSQDTLTQSLATRLFSAMGELAFVPYHRRVAEYLGGRYLAKLIAEGLPSRRVTALMTSPSDGRVVTQLRGLSAWVASYSSEARRLMIDADPVGVGLYGDIASFTDDDQKYLLRSLASTQGTLFGHGWRDGRSPGYRGDTAWAFRSLASKEMVPVIKNLITREVPEESPDQIVEFVLAVLANADRDTKTLRRLVPALEYILHDPDRSYTVREAALRAYLRIIQPDHPAEGLLPVLEAVHTGTLPDPDDQIAGILLDHLYPTVVTPTDVWRYAGPRNSPNFVGRFWKFWEVTIPDESTLQELVNLLDTLQEDTSTIRVRLESSNLIDNIPGQILARYLMEVGETPEPRQVYGWLCVTLPPIQSGGWTEADRQLRSWLEDHPELLKVLFLEALRAEIGQGIGYLWNDRFRTVTRASELPSDFALWCLDQAVRLYKTESTTSHQLLKACIYAQKNPEISKGLTTRLIHERLRGNNDFLELFEATNSRYRSNNSIDSKRYLSKLEQSRARQRRDEEREQREWENYLRSHDTDLQDNILASRFLAALAQVYLGKGHLGMEIDDDRCPSDSRLQRFIGGDPKLAEKVIVALKGSLWRDDIPNVDQIISAYHQSQLPWLVYPILASMYLIAHSQEDIDRVDSSRKEQALTIYYHFDSGIVPRIRKCHDTWLNQDLHGTVHVMYRCVRAAIVNGKDYISAIYELDRIEGSEKLLHDIRLRLLAAFPTRIPAKQLLLFDHIVRQVLSGPTTSQLQELSVRKLSMKSLSAAKRVRWLAINALLSGSAHTEQLIAFTSGNERRIRHLADSLTYVLGSREQSISSDRLETGLLAELIATVGKFYSPLAPSGLVTLDADASVVYTSDVIESFIRQLALRASGQAKRELVRLLEDPGLTHWHGHLTKAQESQRSVYRDTSYSHPSVEEVRQTLNGCVPANSVGFGCTSLRNTS